MYFSNFLNFCGTVYIQEWFLVAFTKKIFSKILSEKQSRAQKLLEHPVRLQFHVFNSVVQERQLNIIRHTSLSIQGVVAKYHSLNYLMINVNDERNFNRAATYTINI